MLLSLYSQYISEKTNKKILETDTGFATYSITESTVYLEDIYIVPAYRKTGLAAKMADQIAEIAKAKGCSKMFGSVIPTTSGSTESLKVLLAYGMKLDSATNNFIVFVKEL